MMGFGDPVAVGGAAGKNRAVASLAPRSMLAPMRPVTYIDLELARPPMILGCERVPFVALVGGVVFVLIVVFGFSAHGLIASAMLLTVGIGALRRAAVYDPHLFAVLTRALRLPRSLPEVPVAKLPPLPFVGYGHPPPRMGGSARVTDRPEVQPKA